MSAKIAFIGPGVMAEAMIGGLIRQKLEEPQNLIAAGPRQERLSELQKKYGIQVETDNAKAAKCADIVVLSVKPQKLDQVLSGLRGSINPEALVVSIVAGAPIEKLVRGLAHPYVVRSMPNTPAQIGEGITVWTVSSAVSEEQKEAARRLLSALGDEIFVEEENYLDMATALSGTGPAYVFLFMEAMVDAGVHLGFPRRIAERLVAKTVRGSVDYYLRREDQVHLARLRNEVTSPGGTSAAALYYLEKAGFRTALSRAIWAAYERSRELGRDAKARPPENGVREE
ncbi:MAG: pyrroline-5-carboxylate reductase [Anaerolineales bacterium]|nr:pyrroline-5-carboxylate reductase [Anaerolineales bacterium]MCS7247026.1 pyrroline-5-carboxylate reductase [Anaerolineales bacterium]MDW8160837.1 pyrroline-5-carboxylate reductase [Anaerolineales bacterium]MDW8446807.1 pyrroline-5-carboxylate reductase [Anaerolineales bacterium]